MFNPSRQQVREFFHQAWQKHQSHTVLTPLESMAVEIVQMHPEYHDMLSDPDSRDADYTVEAGQTNPFLHMSMHLAINEQLSIDQPPGICASYDSLCQGVAPHEAVHIIMEALGEVIWEAQRLNRPFDSQHYLELIQRRVGRH